MHPSFTFMPPSMGSHIECRLCKLYLEQISTEIEQVSQNALRFKLDVADAYQKKLWGLQDAYSTHVKIAHAGKIPSK